MASILKVDTIQDQSGNNIINENADTITIGASGDTVNIVGTLQNGGTNFLQGITMADSWRLTTATNTGTDAAVTTNWERNDSTGYASLGTGLTESSGIFSFPETGLYYIVFTGNISMDSTDPAVVFRLTVTINNSTYNIASDPGSGNGSATSGVGTTITGAYIINVTSITNVKFRFETNNFDANTFLSGSTTRQKTGFTILRIGDSQ